MLETTKRRGRRLDRDRSCDALLQRGDRAHLGLRGCRSRPAERLNVARDPGALRDGCMVRGSSLVHTKELETYRLPVIHLSKLILLETFSLETNNYDSI